MQRQAWFYKVQLTFREGEIDQTNNSGDALSKPGGSGCAFHAVLQRTHQQIITNAIGQAAHYRYSQAKARASGGNKKGLEQALQHLCGHEIKHYL